MSRWFPWLAMLALVAAMSPPLVLDPTNDDFPVSTYPMFTTDRSGPSSISTAVGVTADGDRHRLSSGLLAGADEPILAVRTARVEVGGGRAGSWCVEVARRVADDATVRSGRPVVEIEVVTEVHDPIATLAHGAEPLATTVHASCAVLDP
ncbi:MAG: hypothetical protein ACXIVQ_12780 [Acidimicrobiales bacterium]